MPVWRWTCLGPRVRPTRCSRFPTGPCSSVTTIRPRPRALRRLAPAGQQWLGEPLDVIAVHLDYDDRTGSAYYEVKLLWNEEDLAGAPLAIRRVTDS